MQGLLVSALMSTPVISITPQTRLPEIKNVMREKNIRRLPVLERDRLVGIVSLGDVRNAFASDATTLSIYELTHLLYKVTAKEVMRTEVMTIDIDAPVTAAAEQMLLHKVSGLPVLQDGRLVGMITESDIFRALIAGNTSLPETEAAATSDSPRTSASVLPLV